MNFAYFIMIFAAIAINFAITELSVGHTDYMILFLSVVLRKEK